MDKNLVDLFYELVKIDSPSGEEDKVRNFVKGKLVELDFEVEVDDFGNLYGKRDGKGDCFLLSAHLDTVEPGRGIEPVVVNGMIKSKGNTILGADNKASLSAMLYALELLKHESIETKPLEVVFSVMEEPGVVGIHQFDFGKLCSKTGVCFDKAAPIGTMVVSSPYCRHIECEVFGKSAHAGANPEDGINALVTVVKALSEFPQGLVDVDSTTNVGKFVCDNEYNVVSHKVCFGVEIRSVKKQKLDKYQNMLLDKLSKFCRIAGAKFQWTADEMYQGYKHNLDGEWFKNLRNIFRSFNLEEHVIASGGASDANGFNANGVQVVDLGDGSQNPHSKAEQISVKDLKLLANVVRKIIAV